MTPYTNVGALLALATVAALAATRLAVAAVRVEALWMVSAAYYAACAVSIAALAWHAASRDV